MAGQILFLVLSARVGSAMNIFGQKGQLAFLRKKESRKTSMEIQYQLVLSAPLLS